MTARDPASIAGPHRRYDPLRDAWVLVSAGRTKRPWLGAREAAAPEARPAHDPACYLCPGNLRAGGVRNPDYTGTFVFENDFAALRPDAPLDRVDDGLLVAEGEAGECRVLCFSPRHDRSLGDLAPQEVRAVVELWAAQSAELGARYPWVQVFENRGAAMGASNPHPHGQLWAGTAIPGEAARERDSQRRHLAETGRSLLLDVVDRERRGPRVVEETGDWLLLVPFWATWPFETLLLPKRPAARLPDLDPAARDDLAAVVRRLVRRYDGLFGEPFPYSMGWHQAPFDATSPEGWQLHAHAYPPLLRADARKWMVGYELLSEAQRDITPEAAAEALRAVHVPDAA